MKKRIFAHVFVFFIFLISLILQLAGFSYALVQDADGDGVPDPIDQCPGSVNVVDQFGCSCEQKSCPSDSNPCTNDCSVMGQLPTCAFVNNDDPCAGGRCSGGKCVAALKAAPASSSTVFVSSLTYNGDLGGLAGAQQKCQALADAVPSLQGKKFRAWLSSSTIPAKDRIIHSNLPYELIDETKIANDWSDITDGTLQNPINKDEKGNPVAVENVWANTNPDGTIANLNDDKTCKDWTSSSIGSLFGNTAVDSTWTSNGPCSSLYYLYCFES